MTPLKPGTRVRSAVCDTELMVISVPSEPVEVSCGGAPVIPHGEEPPAGATLADDDAEGTLLGKRYVNESGDLELLCTKPGKGSLACNGVRLTVKGAKPLPASD